MNELQPWLQSSQDPGEVANKVKGAILAMSALIIGIAATVFHITLSANDIISLASGIGVIAGAVWFIYGFILHGVTYFGRVR